jgi:hypothetical protein
MKVVGGNQLVVGMGEVGQGVFSVLQGQYSVFARDKDPVLITEAIVGLHVAIPYSEQFEEIVAKYIEQYKPRVTIVYSTVPIGTCERIGAVHSPVEGKHPQLGLSIQNSARWMGCSDEAKLTQAEEIWQKLVPVRKLPKADFTEWLKLRSTSKFGVNIVWAEYEATVTKELGMDFSAVKQFDLDYNNLYQRMGMLQFQRYILDPPEGKIGGHCLVPNAKVLNGQFPSKLLEMVIAMEVKKP